MKYNYPDKNDALTANLIDSEFEDVYWMKSEDKVIEEAINAIKNLPERNGQEKAFGFGLRHGPPYSGLCTICKQHYCRRT